MYTAFASQVSDKFSKIVVNGVILIPLIAIAAIVVYLLVKGFLQTNHITRIVFLAVFWIASIVLVLGVGRLNERFARREWLVSIGGWIAIFVCLVALVATYTKRRKE